MNKIDDIQRVLCFAFIFLKINATRIFYHINISLMNFLIHASEKSGNVFVIYSKNLNIKTS
jgi:hypothetical protein